MNKLFTIFYYVLAIGALALGTFLVLMQTDIIPGYDVRIVQSGSMEPVIGTGTVVIIQDRDQYLVGDIITFQHEDSTSELPTTHRIIDDSLEDGELAYTTQGDANDSPDVETVQLSDIHGTVIFSIPYLGYVLDFARQPLGFILLIGVPALLIVFEEASTIYRALYGRRDEDEEGDGSKQHTVAPQDDEDPDDPMRGSSTLKSSSSETTTL